MHKMCFYPNARRMKREVASSLVERGVAERVRLTQAYDKKKTELQKQHDAVKAQLDEHKEKVCIIVSTLWKLEKCSKTFGLNLIPLKNSVCVFRLERYLKKIANLGHAFHPKDF